MEWGLLLTGTLAGTAAGAILAFFSHVAPRFGGGNFILEREHPRLFGKPISRREAYLVGLLAHLILSGAFGFMFALLVLFGIFASFSYGAMLWFVAGLTLLVGLVIMPMEGHGFFGRGHDAWFMIDALLTNFLWGNLFLLLIRLWMLR
jgi:hypothetical protein